MIHHRDTESTEGKFLLPDRETAIGQKNAALRAIIPRLIVLTPPLWQPCKQFHPAKPDGCFSLAVVSRPGKNPALCASVPLW
ncbi:MAG: hypothetical protein BA865_09530 [Desulfobacterales bacterium S5133MH4]|jgi:hypothetical protein|nr:MAG: hypothetical protein BA865_09530 [Desulfobacterales bacterium S5133MH4]